MTGPKPRGPLWKTYLQGIPLLAVLVPLIFWLTFGHVGTFAIAFTLSLMALCALIAFGLWQLERREKRKP